MEIADWRIKIDELDRRLVELLNQRAEAAHEIGKLKRNTSMPIYEPDREKMIFENVQRVSLQFNAHILSPGYADRLLERSIRAVERIAAAGVTFQVSVDELEVHNVSGIGRERTRAGGFAYYVRAAARGDPRRQEGVCIRARNDQAVASIGGSNAGAGKGPIRQHVRTLLRFASRAKENSIGEAARTG